MSLYYFNSDLILILLFGVGFEQLRYTIVIRILKENLNYSTVELSENKEQIQRVEKNIEKDKKELKRLKENLAVFEDVVKELTTQKKDIIRIGCFILLYIHDLIGWPISFLFDVTLTIEEIFDKILYEL